VLQLEPGGGHGVAHDRFERRGEITLLVRHVPGLLF
jgi:hypothetical protein